MGSTKILASPRILVLNKQRAEIQLGSRLGFRSTVTQNIIGTTQAVQFLNTGTLLRLRPFVSSDDVIRMEIHPERSEGVVDPTTGLPSQTLAELTTYVMVPNGATLVIGGLMEDDDSYTQTGLPGLSRLPILGYLFGTREKIDQRRELVVLLTPHVWSPGQACANPQPLAAQGDKKSTENKRQKRTTVQPGLASTPDSLVSGLSLPTVTQAPELQRLLPTSSPDPSPPTRSVLPRSERIEVSRQTELADTLEARAAFLPADAIASMSPGDEQRQSQYPPARLAKTDPMVAQTSLGNNQSSQSAGSDASVQAAIPAIRRHTVRPGEDFSSIAKAYYGSPRLARALWWVNRRVVAWPGALVAGTRIVIPPIEQLEGRSSGSRASRAATFDPQVQPASQKRPSERLLGGQTATHVLAVPDPETAATNSGPPQGGYAIHVVQPNETLRGIARDRLGDSRRFQEIAEMNRDLLTNSRISAGMRLLLPPDARPVPTGRN